MPELQMTNKETAVHFRKWFEKEHGPFAWPTDGCGYNQSVRFSQYKNENLNGQDIKSFCLEYADKIENEPDSLCQCIHPNVKLMHYCYCCIEPSCKFHGLNSDGSRCL